MIAEYPTTVYERKRRVLLVLSENRKTFEVQNIPLFTASKREDRAVMASWPMTTRAANSLERRIKDALKRWHVKGDHYLHNCESVLSVWTLGDGEKFPFLQWV